MLKYNLNAMLKSLCIFFAFIAFHFSALPKQARAQTDIAPLPATAVLPQDSLHHMALRIIEPDEDEERLANNQLFFNALRQALVSDSTLAETFDSVRTVSFLRDPGGRFRIVTWYVPFRSGGFKYFGFVQTPATNRQAGQLFELKDLTPLLERVSMVELSQDQWYGAYYYEMIHTRHRRKDYFTLLGWKGDNPQSRIRVIEPFVLTEQGPVFGAQVFDAGERKPYRIIFEYSARVSMSLKYHGDFPKGRRKTVPMIIFDRLSPTHETLQGNFRFYVPEVNVFDGFEFKNGRWVFIPDVDARVTIDPSRAPLNPVLPR
jgi:hypothetical protein